VPEKIAIRGQVAKLVNEEELIINRGKEAGVVSGMTFWVMDPSTEHILDPETGEDLGGVPRTKVRVMVTSVGSRVSLAERVAPSSNPFSGVAGLFINQSPSRKSVGIANPRSWPEGVEVGDPIYGTKDVPDERYT